MSGPLKSEIERLREFYRQVTAAAGDLDGLPDGHCFELVWHWERNDGEPEDIAEGDPAPTLLTAGMIRRAGMQK